MIETIFSATHGIKNEAELEAKFIEIGYWDMFSDIQIKYLDRWFYVIKWILYTFSIDSEYIGLYDDWERTKRRIAEIVRLPKDDLFEEIILLKSEQVYNVVREYLDHQGSREFKHLIVLRETYEKMLASPFIISDYDQISKNIKYAKEIYGEMLEYEQRVKERFKNLWNIKTSIDKQSAKKSLRLESFVGNN